MGVRLSGPETARPTSFRQLGRHVAPRYTQFYNSHTEGHTDQMRRLKCARETRDLTLADTAASDTVRMLLTGTDIEIFSTSPRKLRGRNRRKEAGKVSMSSVVRFGTGETPVKHKLKPE